MFAQIQWSVTDVYSDTGRWVKSFGSSHFEPRQYDHSWYIFFTKFNKVHRNENGRTFRMGVYTAWYMYVRLWTPVVPWGKLHVMVTCTLHHLVQQVATGCISYYAIMVTGIMMSIGCFAVRYWHDWQCANIASGCNPRVWCNKGYHAENHQWPLLLKWCTFCIKVNPSI